MSKKKLKELVSWIERKGSSRYEFDRVCKVVYVNKSVNNFGDKISGVVGDGFLVFIGFICGGVMYEGFVRSEVLNVFPVNNPQPGCKYRIQCNQKPRKHPNHAKELLCIENIIPSRNFYYMFF